jgi:DNA-directed RNA polymerase specialized sigma24 family protein
LPPGVDEAELLDAIERTGRLLAKHFAFGSYSAEDIKQMIAVFAMEAIRKGSYDTTRSLASFIFAHSRNRLINLRRDSICRADGPCKRCQGGNPCQSDGKTCDKHNVWWERQRKKASVRFPVGIDNVADEKEPRTHSASEVEANAEASELERLIDEHLPIEMRENYLRMRAGENVLPKKRELVRAAILGIFEAAGLTLDDFRTTF